MEERFADVPEVLWKRVEPYLPIEPPRPRGGRPRNDNRRVLAGILYRLRTGCQWKALPREYFGSGSTCHERFQEWVSAGIFAKVFEQCLRYYHDACRGIDWRWCSLRQPVNGEGAQKGDHTGPNPTDRAKSGVKRHVLTDARGVPVGVTITAANVHDKWMVAQTLDAVPLRAGRGVRRPHHLCLDKGYDYREPEAEARERGIVPHIRRRGEKPLIGCVRGGKPRRWVVERTNSLAQPISRSPRALGAKGRELPRSSHPRLRAHRPSTGVTSFSDRL